MKITGGVHVTSIKLEQLLSSDISPGGSAGTLAEPRSPVQEPAPLVGQCLGNFYARILESTKASASPYPRDPSALTYTYTYITVAFCRVRVDSS